MAMRDIKGKILNFFKLQSPSLQATCFKVFPIDNDKNQFILNLKYYGKKSEMDYCEIKLDKH